MKKRLLARVFVVAMMLTMLVAPLSASAASYGLVRFWGDVRLIYSQDFEGGMVGCTVELYSGDTLLASQVVENVAGAFSFYKNLGPGTYTIKVTGVDDAYAFNSVWVNDAQTEAAAPEISFVVTGDQIPGEFGPVLFKFDAATDPECNPSMVYVFGRAVDWRGDGMNDVQWNVFGRHTVDGQAPYEGWNRVATGKTGGHLPGGAEGGWFGVSIQPGQYDEWLIVARRLVANPSGADGYSVPYLHPAPRYENDPWVVEYEGPLHEHVWGWAFKNSDFECMPSIIGAYPTVGFLLQEQVY